jgi:hypothetical protein
MTHPVELAVKCADFLKDNHHAYAAKARRKKIALIGVEVTNRRSEDVRLLLRTVAMQIRTVQKCIRTVAGPMATVATSKTSIFLGKNRVFSDWHEVP